jgi:methylated-DNA-[protein]-cysteine S-methyltransferase
MAPRAVVAEGRCKPRPVGAPILARCRRLALRRGLRYAATVKLAYHVMSSPLGLLFLARTERGLRFVDFLERKSLKRIFAAHAEAVPDAEWEPSLLRLKPVVDQLDSYFCGNLTRFDLPLDLAGTEFQLRVWRALCRIPYGSTCAYGQIAKALDQPGAARAVGLANNHNPIPIIVPCHRVIGADGSLTGYGGGLPRKRKLLDLEARFAHPIGRAGNPLTTS